MKKKFIFTLLLSLLCVSSIFSFKATTTTNAISEQAEINVVITNSGSNFSATSSEIEISGVFSSFEQILNEVKLHANEETLVSIEFANFNLSNTTNNTLVINSTFPVVISGNIVSSESEPIFTLYSSASVCFENITFESSLANNIISISSNSIVTFGENINYTNSNSSSLPNLINFISGASITLTENCNSNIKILLSDFATNEKIISCTRSQSELISLYSPSSSAYTIESSYMSNQGGVCASTYINFRFMTNGGSYTNINASNYYEESTTGDYIITYPYNQINFGYKDFNTQGTISKDYSIFNGWFGICELNNITYYFDCQMLSDFLNSNSNFSQIGRFFTTDINNLSNDYSILGYSNEDTTSLNLYKHFEFFYQNNLEPTYIAKWTYETFKIDFVTNSDETIDSLSVQYLDNIPQLPVLEKTGYDFDGWFTDRDFNTAFNYVTMPATNITLYAKWTLKTHEIKFNLGYSESIPSLELHFGEEITLPENPQREGYDFDGWFLDENFETRFNFTTMPDRSLTAYAKWNIKYFSITIYNNISQLGIIFGEFAYGSSFPELSPYTLTGYEFIGWYNEKNLETEFIVPATVTSDVFIYAGLSPIIYTINFVTNSEIVIDKISGHYQDSITLPTNLQKSNYKFMGWYQNADFTIEFNSQTMPAENITLYAKWEEKQTLDISLSKQSYVYEETHAVYQNTTGLSGCKIYYLVNGEWSLDVPTEIGEYDIRLTRDEDANYKAVDLILEKGFSIVTPTTSVAWIIAFFYIALVAEIVVSIFVRILRKRKMSATFVFIGTIFITNSQFAHLIISGGLCLAGFIYMVYQIVELTRTVNNENFAPSKEDNRERFKNELVFQNDKKNSDLEFTTQTKTDESFGDKYSNSDILSMLEKDTFAEKYNYTRKEDDESSIYDSYYDDDTPLNEDDSNSENIMPQSHYDIINNANGENQQNEESDYNHTENNENESTENENSANSTIESEDNLENSLNSNLENKNSKHSSFIGSDNQTESDKKDYSNNNLTDDGEEK